MSINRRQALKQAAYFMGGALSAPTIMGVMQGCSAEAKASWVPSFFSEPQAITVQELAETILPATDTKGAIELGVPQFIEQMVGVVYGEKDRDLFMEGLASFEAMIEEKYGSSFSALSKEDRLSVAKELNSKMQDPANQPASGEPRPFFWTFKELTVAGYFTTEYGATQVLQYQIVPGAFNGCMPIEEAGDGGRTYAV
ncbi:MAG: gluconate 2-dehydrogenase subunit 3 family protein [Bacteroidota bacterium]